MDRRRALLASASSSGGDLAIPPNNEVWYISGDEQIITPDQDNAFGANIVSNTYENGKGVIKFDGPVTQIGYRAFYYEENLIEISLPKSVLSICFRCCENLTRVSIPKNGLLSIEQFAFQDCFNLTHFTIPSSVTYIGSYAFHNCSKLEFSVKFPSSMSSIGDYTFDNCRKLLSIDIPDSITRIGKNALSYCFGLTEITIPNSVTSIGYQAFSHCENLTTIVLPNNITSIEEYTFSSCSNLTSITIPSSVTSIGDGAFAYAYALTTIICEATTAPAIDSETFYKVKYSGILYYPTGANYSSWLTNSYYYLGYYGWTGREMYTPTSYYDLTITADDVSGRDTTTTIYWSCMSDGISAIDGSQVTGVILTGTAISAEFPQNKSTTKTVKRTITFEYQGLTASTTITQGVWKTAKYTVVLNNQWQLSSSISNPNASAYDGVYESFSNKGVNNSQAVMYLDIEGYDTFKIYIRSYAESSYDYVMVSQPDQTIDNNTSYSNTSLVKAHTSGSQNSGTAISNYQLVEYTGLNSGKHRITILYRKDVSAAEGYDQGYLLIPKNQ